MGEEGPQARRSHTWVALAQLRPSGTWLGGVASLAHPNSEGGLIEVTKRHTINAVAKALLSNLEQSHTITVLGTNWECITNSRTWLKILPHVLSTPPPPTNMQLLGLYSD